jgi:opacity protein-like surface antigen
MRSVTTIALALASAFAVAAAARAGERESELPAGFGRWKQKLSLSGGYGVGFGAVGSEGTDAADVELAAVIPAWGIGLSDILGEDRWYRGSWEALLEAQLAVETQPRSGFGGGAVLNFRYNFLPWRRVAPFFGIGLGLGAIDFDLVSQADGFNFFLQTGGGVHFFVGERLALTAEARWHHISNAQTKDANSGINTALFLLGTTYFFD